MVQLPQSNSFQYIDKLSNSFQCAFDKLVAVFTKYKIKFPSCAVFFWIDWLTKTDIDKSPQLATIPSKAAFFPACRKSELKLIFSYCLFISHLYSRSCMLSLKQAAMLFLLRLMVLC